MVYKEFQGMKISALGFGAMRLPVINGEEENIDEATVTQMVEYAMRQGVNYYDTAWGYHKGQSEIVMGKVLSSYRRDTYYLASKFPGYDLDNMPYVEKIFEKQLGKCRTDFFDFYLIHNVCEMNINEYLDDDKYGIYTYLMEQKKNGRIKHLGFSAHGDLEVMKRFLEAYGKDMEFCQLQINYIDWTFQSAKEKVELCKEYGIPVWVMEPVRGGKLASISEEYESELKELRPDETVPAWAFRFIQSIPEVVVTLSGMSNKEQVKQNIKTFEENKPLSGKEMDTLLDIADRMIKKTSLPCTACRYCTGHCPQGLDIPRLLDLYNEHVLTGGGFLAPMVLSVLPKDKQPSSCIACHSCEKVCPQQIKIADALANFSEKLSK